MKNAYVALLYKTSIYFLGALILASSLKKTKTKADIVLMYHDVSPEQLNVLKLYYDKLIKVDYIFAPNLIENVDQSRFKEVFTKFHCFELTQYEKILMIDIDMLVMKNMDLLYKLPAPAAFKRGYKEFKNGTKIPLSEFERNDEMISGINAGLMLLEPSKKTFKEIMKDIKHPPKNYKPARDPEQAFISWFYRSDWHHIHHFFNYQFTLSHVFPHKYKLSDIPKIYNIHYSSPTKPWNFIRDPESLNRNPYKVYYQLWIDEYERVKKEILNKHKIDITKLY